MRRRRMFCLRWSTWGTSGRRLRRRWRVWSRAESARARADRSMLCSGERWRGCRNSDCLWLLLSDAEGAEDQVEDVVGGGGAGNGVEGAEGAVEIEQQHFVGDFRGYGAGRGIESCE